MVDLPERGYTMALPLLLAPLLAKGLGLVGNAALALGTDWIEEKTGVDLGKANLSDEEFVRLEEFQMRHEEELLKIQQEDDRLAQEYDKMFLEDVQSARNVQTTALAQEDIFSKRFLYWYTLFWTFAAVAYIGGITFYPIPETQTRFADVILGFLLGTVIAQIINFFYGSSKGSADKNAMLQKELEKKQ